MPRVTIDVTDIIRQADQFRRAGLDTRPAVARVLNWVGAKANTQVKRALAAQMGLPYSRISAGVRTYRASGAILVFDIVGSGTPIPLVEFAARQTRAGVTARPWGARRLFRGTFLARSPSAAGEQVFRRIGGRREKRFRVGPTGKVETYTTELPIEKLWGPSIPREMVRGSVPPAFEQAARDNFAPRMAHELGRLFRGAG